MRKYLLFSSLMVVMTLSFAQKKKHEIPGPSLNWKVKVGTILGSPVISGNTVYIASGDSTLRALDTQSGKEKWKFRTFGAMRSTPTLASEKILLVSEDGLLYCLNKDSGKLLWRYHSPQGTLSERKYDRADYFQSSPTVYNEKVFVGLGDFLYAVDLSNGQLIWSYKTGNLVHVKPAIANGKVIFGSYDGYVYALQAENGQPVWKFKTVGQRFFPNGEVMGQPVVSKEVVYIGSRDFNFYALEVNSGYCYWNKVFPKGWALAASVMRDSVLYLGTSDDYVMLALNPRNGAELWRTQLQYNIFGSMACEGEYGYVGTLMGRLFRLKLKTGEVDWIFDGDSYRLNKNKYFDEAGNHLESALRRFGNFDEVLKMYSDMGAIFSTPALGNGIAIFGGMDGLLYCINTIQ